MQIPPLMKKVIDNNQSELKGFRKIRKMKKVQKENILITFQFRLLAEGNMTEECISGRNERWNCIFTAAENERDHSSC